MGPITSKICILGKGLVPPVLSPDKCFIYQGCVFRGGYGRVYYKGKRYSAHRLVALGYGLIDIDEFYTPTISVLHQCDNPPCINPAHLFKGDNVSNNLDMKNKMRHCYGVKNNKSKLTEHDVNLIRCLFARGVTRRILAASFNVHYSTISRVVNLATWRHLA